MRFLPALLGLFLLVPGCTTLQQVAALQRVDFDLDRVANGFVAGVDLDRIVENRRVGIADGARITAAALSGDVPLRFTLFVGAENPADNPVAAQLVSLDWTLFMDGTETVSGVYNDDRQIAPGSRTLLPVDIELDLVRFFGNNAGDLIDLIGDLAGDGSQPTILRLDAQPTINTSFGPLRYPGRISIEFPVGESSM